MNDHPHHSVEWEHMIEAVREEPSVPPSLESAVMQSILAKPPRAVRSFSRAWVRPVSLSAVAAVAAAALFWLARASETPERTSAEVPNVATVLVEFTLEAERARSVVLTGSFNHWENNIALRGPDADGRWHVRVSLLPGVHQYAFVVDGVWTVDPRAERVVDDGFGNQNALLAVRGRAAPSL